MRLTQETAGTTRAIRCGPVFPDTADTRMMIHESHVLPGDSPEARDYEDYEQMYHGLGWYVVKNPEIEFIAHGGGPGFASDMRLYPDRELGMVVIANGSHMPKRKINDLIASLEW